MSYRCNECGKSMANKEILFEHLKKWHSRLSKQVQRKLKRQYNRR